MSVSKCCSMCICWNDNAQRAKVQKKWTARFTKPGLGVLTLIVDSFVLLQERS